MTRQQIEWIFTYHPPFGDQVERMQEIREAIKHAALLVQAYCPESREKSLSITNLQMASMCANAAIAINEVRPEVGDAGG
jgi:hypothetical protein